MPELFGSEKRRFLVRCVGGSEERADAIEPASVELNFSDGLPAVNAPAQRQTVKVVAHR